MLPGVRTAPKEQSRLHIQPLRQPDCHHALDSLAVIFQSAFGPGGKLKSIHNNRGGHVTLTSSSSRILQTVSISKPVLRLITTALQGHLNLYSDGGLFAGLVSLNLVKKGLATGLHQRLVTEVNDVLLKKSLDYLSSEQCRNCRVDIDTSHVDGLLRLIASVLASKPGCQLSDPERTQLSRLLLEAIVNSTTNTNTAKSSPSSEGNLQYVGLEGQPPQESHLIQGILLEAPQYPTYTRQPQLHVKRTQDLNIIRVALVSTSMSGDTDDFLDGQYEVEDEASVLSQAVLTKISVFVESLVRRDVGLVLCQKVVHPRVKRQLKEAGVVTLDRLGLKGITVAQTLAGGTLVSSWLVGVSDDDLGHLCGVTLKQVGGRSYVHLEAVKTGSAPCGVVTLVLCNRSEEALEELKHTCTVAREVVRHTMLRPWALRGAGLWQAHLAKHLHRQIRQCKKAWSSRLGCSELQIVTIGDIYVQTLAQIAMTTNNRGNHGGCNGMLVDDVISTLQAEVLEAYEQVHQKISGPDLLDDNSGRGVTKADGINSTSLQSDTADIKETGEGDNPILDCYEAYVNALRTGVGAANIVLSIQHFVQDVN